MSVEVIKPGAHSTFQDLGRRGYQRFGVQVNGAMDERSHRLANMLVGNPPSEATLEITLLGPVLRFHSGATIAVCGADLEPCVDGIAITLNRRIEIQQGAVLSFGSRKSGVRAYLAVRGGYNLPAVMGSLSTNTRAGFGGLGGLPLRKGDLISFRVSAPLPPRVGRILPNFPAGVVRTLDDALRVVAGREWEFFSAQAQRRFLASEYCLSPQSDRMGYRLTGEALSLSSPHEILSETVALGAIQVPADGQPIILMADRGTTGGYPKIANVVSVDLPRLAQMMPGQSLRFELIELAEAQRLAVMQARVFTLMEAAHG